MLIATMPKQASEGLRRKKWELLANSHKIVTMGSSKRGDPMAAYSTLNFLFWLWLSVFFFPSFVVTCWFSFFFPFYLYRLHCEQHRYTYRFESFASFSYQIDILATFFKMPEKLYVTYNQVRLNKNPYSIRYPNKSICRYTNCVKNPPTRSSSKYIQTSWSQSAVVVTFLLESSGTLAWHRNSRVSLTDIRSFE